MEVRTFKQQEISLPDELRSDIFKQVQTWLDNETSPMFQIDLNDQDGSWVKTLLFQRSVISIKNALNQWQIWHISPSAQLNKIFSSYKTEVCINDYVENFITFPNEVRSERYSSDKGARESIDNLLGIFEENIESNKDKVLKEEV
jgi:hypothetical protein